MTIRSRKARIAIAAAGLVIAGSVFGATPSMAAASSAQAESSQSQPAQIAFLEKSVEFKIRNETDSSASFRYHSGRQEHSTTVDINSQGEFDVTGHSAVGRDLWGTVTLSDGTTIFLEGKNPSIGHPSIKIGSSSSENETYTVSNSGDTINVTVNGHNVTATYTDGDYKSFDITID